jgi:type I restriction-modification system DNA methylase subunit
MQTLKTYSLEYYIKQNQRKTMPYTIPQIAEYYKATGSLPFNVSDEKNWVYEYLIERQRKSGVYNDQFFTPPQLSKLFFETVESFTFMTKYSTILDLCCGFGMLGKEFVDRGYCRVTGIDSDIEQDFDFVCNEKEINFHNVQLEDYNPEEKNFDIIISNPPYQKEFYPLLFNKAHDLIDEYGSLYVILPSTFMDIKHKETQNALKKWQLHYVVEHNIPFARTNVQTSIYYFQKNND